jgi:hypothetical protein
VTQVSRPSCVSDRATVVMPFRIMTGCQTLGKTTDRPMGRHLNVHRSLRVANDKGADCWHLSVSRVTAEH